MEARDLFGTGLVEDPGAIPLVLAVAGHRDPRQEDLPLLRERFRNLISELFAVLPNTPLIMLNGLGRVWITQEIAQGRD
ncbi:MAG: hypothetical protein VKI83_05225 [Synechococcaceae cyanobacterium]|nr:hypothetical protein [Synechococcaceae cyanobacterium]